jgi:hypothetical protein
MQHEGFICDINNNIDHVLDHNDGRNGNSVCSQPNSERVEAANNLHAEDRYDDSADINIYIFRFQFTEEFNIELSNFAKIHQYDHRKVFKEAWEVWLEENANLVGSEVARLNNIGYEGDVIDKMFKSARYYYRKKSTEKKAPKERRPYISINKDLLASMDNHIKKGLLNENFKPSDGFAGFCNASIDLLKDHVAMLCKNGMTNSEEIKQKLKKTYKNRYFLIVQEYND